MCFMGVHTCVLYGENKVGTWGGERTRDKCGIGKEKKGSYQLVLLCKISMREAEKEPSVVKCLLRRLCNPMHPQTEEKTL